MSYTTMIKTAGLRKLFVNLFAKPELGELQSALKNVKLTNSKLLSEKEQLKKELSSAKMKNYGAVAKGVVGGTAVGAGGGAYAYHKYNQSKQAPTTVMKETMVTPDKRRYRRTLQVQAAPAAIGPIGRNPNPTLNY